MSLKEINREELKQVFEVLEEAFITCAIDYYLIGALARDVWYAKGDKRFRTTRDIDFAILIGSKEQYDNVRKYLEEEKRYTPSTTNTFVLITPEGTPIDLLPFGAVDFDNDAAIEIKGLTNTKLNGFMEVYNAGTERIEVLEGHSFEVATLPAIVLLKLIAYDDRPEMRIKDARDIANIITHYFDLETKLIYEKHNDLYAAGQPDREPEQIAAVVIGRILKQILYGNMQLYNRITTIVKAHAEKQEKSIFVRNMALEANKSTDEIVSLLNHILYGLGT